MVGRTGHTLVTRLMKERPGLFEVVGPVGDKLYLTCFYEGSLLLKLGADNQPNVLWKRTKKSGDPELPENTEQLHCSSPTGRISWIIRRLYTQPYG